MAASATVAVYTGRSSEPRPRSSLLSQRHHGVELNFLSIQLSGYGMYHSANQVYKFSHRFRNFVSLGQ